MGSSDVERQSSFPEVDATVTERVKIEGTFDKVKGETDLSPSVSAAVTNISWSVAFLAG